MSFQVALQLTIALLSVATLVRALEDWLTRAEYGTGGVMSAEVTALQRAWGRSLLSRLLFHITSSHKLLNLCMLMRIALPISLLLALSLRQSSGLTVGLLAANLLFAVFFLLRCGYGADGADQMLIVVNCGALLATSSNIIVHRTGVWFITLQLILSFFVAGLAKLFGREWRSGVAMAGILTTARYSSSPWLGAMLVRRPVISQALCWAVISVETLFPVVLLGIPTLTVATLIGGLLFHVSVAFTMGLNNFMYTFAAAYPISVYALL